MTRKIERRRQPVPRGHVELPAALLRKPGYRSHCPFKRLCVQRLPISDSSEIRQIVRSRPQPRHRPRGRCRPKDPNYIYRATLPYEHRGDSYDPENSKEGLVRREERTQPSPLLLEVKPTTGGEDLNHRIEEFEVNESESTLFCRARRFGSIGGSWKERLDSYGEKRREIEVGGRRLRFRKQLFRPWGRRIGV